MPATRPQAKARCGPDPRAHPHPVPTLSYACPWYGSSEWYANADARSDGMCALCSYLLNTRTAVHTDYMGGCQSRPCHLKICHTVLKSQPDPMMHPHPHLHPARATSSRQTVSYDPDMKPDLHRCTRPHLHPAQAHDRPAAPALPRQQGGQQVQGPAACRLERTQHL